ncbi:MAG: hypothetical protein JWM80_1043 [Cyanobacteria bacterium RYN_339]|nr:hypothetical protein [Cyanobacteria bacterium RYN_339]
MRPLAFALLTIVVGLASRQVSACPAWIGDVLYAVMAFWLFRTGADARLAWVLATAFCGLIELSQLYHAPWIDGIRAMRLGALVLGTTFLWSDLLCYLAGTTAAYVIERTAFPSAPGTR